VFKKNFENIVLDDENILQVLSEVGVYITDYTNGETLVSNIWKNFPEHFNLDIEANYLEFIHNI
jgi:hypothetical protein